MPFGKHFASFLEVIVDTFRDFAEKVEPHESTVNLQSDWGSGACENYKKLLKKHVENARKTKTKQLWIFIEFWHHFGCLLGSLWDPKCDQKIVPLFVLFFLSFLRAARARRVRGYCKDGEIAPWCGALILKKGIL